MMVLIASEKDKFFIQKYFVIAGLIKAFFLRIELNWEWNNQVKFQRALKQINLKRISSFSLTANYLNRFFFVTYENSLIIWP